MLKEAPCIARLMAVENVAYLLGARKGPKEAHRCAKGTVVVSDVSMMAVGFAQRVYTEARIFALLMAVERGV